MANKRRNKKNRKAERRKEQTYEDIIYNLLMDKIRLTRHPIYMADQAQPTAQLVYAMKHDGATPNGAYANAIAECISKTDTGYTIDQALYDRLTDEAKELFVATPVVTPTTQPEQAKLGFFTKVKLALAFVFDKTK